MKRLLTFGSFVLSTSLVMAQTTPPAVPPAYVGQWNAHVSEGRKHLDAGQVAEARTAFRSAVEVAQDNGSRARALFYVALTEEAANEPSRAADLYRKALRVEPGLSAAANNLAQLLAREGKADEALKYQTLAADSPDARAPFYRRNLAAMYAQRGDTARATREYVIVLKAEPNDLEAERALFELCPPDAAVAYLSQMIAKGAVDRAQEYALAKMAATQDSSARRDLLEIVATTLARQQVTPEQFPSHPAAASLRAWAEDPAIGGGIRELSKAFAGTGGPAPWWSNGDSGTAYGTLARELALAHRNAGRNEEAERLLLGAVEATYGEDPDVVLALAELYFAQERIPKIDELLGRYGDRLFSGKSNAYLKGDWPVIYRFHVALGTMYAAVGKSGDRNDPRSAIFQLEHARAAAEENNRKESAAKIYVDPALVERLAVTYEKIARPDEAAKVRLSAAETYVKQGRTQAAQETLAPVEKQRGSLGTEDTKRYRILQEAVPKSAVPKPGADVVVKPPR
jgi:tetratricopeptide (TPR) repeat protein